MLFSSGLCGKIISLQIGIRTVSDHAPISAIWEEHLRIPKPRVWHLNNYLLESPGLVSYADTQTNLFSL